MNKNRSVNFWFLSKNSRSLTGFETRVGEASSIVDTSSQVIHDMNKMNCWQYLEGTRYGNKLRELTNL